MGIPNKHKKRSARIQMEAWVMPVMIKTLVRTVVCVAETIQLRNPVPVLRRSGAVRVEHETVLRVRLMAIVERVVDASQIPTQRSMYVRVTQQGQKISVVLPHGPPVVRWQVVEMG